MTTKTKNFDQAVDELEKANGHDKVDSAIGGLRERLQSELNNLEETLNKIKPHVEDFTRNASREASKAKASVENQVHKNPWAAIGIVGLIFFVLGFLFSHKSRRED